MPPILFRTLALSLALPALATARADATLNIDGIPDEAQWQQAEAVGAFKVTQPYTLEAPLHPTRARIMGTPEGIALAFWCEQPASTERRVDQTARDADTDGDRVNLFIDFDADAKVGYNFMIALSGSVQDSSITNERQFSTDWDGQWQAAVHDHGDHWTAEMLIPWTTASMAGSDTPKRTVAVQVDRVIGAIQQRSAWPGASFMQPRFMSEFARIELDQFQQSAFKVYPYASVLSDQISERLESKLGLDLLWKPSGDFQLTAALNPDFGQVEADELVVNFDAIETFFSDKRPFFTENQGLFDVRTPDNGLLVYTRRIGGPSDSSEDGAADIDLALKINGRYAGTDYGVLTAFEHDYADDAQSAFLVQRLQRSVGSLQLGYLGTFADRPARERLAQVHAFDFNWRPDSRWLLSGQVLGSWIDQFGTRADDEGAGAWLRAFYIPSPNWQQELELTHFDAELDFNDLGFQRRASLNELEYTLTRRFNTFAEGDPRSSVTWAMEPQLRSNDRGERLPAVMQLRREVEFADGGYSFAQLNWASSGKDDLIGRGPVAVDLPARLQYSEYFRRLPRMGNVVLEGGVFAQQDGLDGYARGLSGELRWLPREDFNMELEATWTRSPDWLIWQGPGLLATFERRMLEAGLDLNWFPAAQHELRAKLQWVGLQAAEAEAYRIARSGRLDRSDETVDPFTVSTLGLQLRYRWNFKPDSDLYVVYSRGSGLFDRNEEGLGTLFDRSLNARTADQFLVKLRYGF